MLNLLNRKVTVSGIDCVIVVDEATTDPTRGIVSDDHSLGDNFSLIAMPDVVDGAISKSGGLPVYGLWQTLFNSSLVNTGAGLNIIYTGEGSEGHYLLRDGINWLTGIVFNGEAQGLPEKLISQITSGELTVHIIEEDVSSLKRPPSALISSAARMRKLRGQGARRKFMVFGLIGGIAVGAFLIDASLNALHEGKKDRYAEMQSQLKQKQAALDVLRSDRAVGLMAPKQNLMRAWFLYSQFPRGSVSGTFDTRAYIGESIIDPTQHIGVDVLPSAIYDVHKNTRGESEVSWSASYEN